MVCYCLCCRTFESGHVERIFKTGFAFYEGIRVNVGTCGQKKVPARERRERIG